MAAISKIPFDTVKALVVQGYDFEDPEMDQSDDIEDIKKAKTIDELLSVLDGFGFNGGDAVEFVFDCVIEY